MPQQPQVEVTGQPAEGESMQRAEGPKNKPNDASQKANIGAEVLDQIRVLVQNRHGGQVKRDATAIERWFETKSFRTLNLGQDKYKAAKFNDVCSLKDQEKRHENFDGLSAREVDGWQRAKQESEEEKQRLLTAIIFDRRKEEDTSSIKDEDWQLHKLMILKGKGIFEGRGNDENSNFESKRLQERVENRAGCGKRGCEEKGKVCKTRASSCHLRSSSIKSDVRKNGTADNTGQG